MDFNNKNVTFYKVQATDLLDDDFESTIEEFTNYYHIDCLQDIRERLAQVYLLKLSGKVIGFVTLAMAHIPPNATKEIRAKEVNGNIPALLISHLAVHKDYQRRHVGMTLLDFIFDIVPTLVSLAGCRYVILNPRDDQGVRDFYTNYGFQYYANLNDDKKLDAFLMDLTLYDLKRA